MKPKVNCFAFAVLCAMVLASTSSSLFAQATSEATPAKRFDLQKRASEIDPRAKEHPEINFVFADAKFKPTDIQHAVVDTRVPSEGKLVIWLMGHNQGLFERISSYGLHGIQVHYANGWFGTLDPKVRDSGEALGNIRLEAATGEDHSPYVSIPKPDSLAERSVQFVKWLSQNNKPGKWDQFLNEEQTDLRWEKVILAGISHGSTTAARFAKARAVDRVVMFSGPRDQFESWQSLPSATDKNRFFGFTHVLDDGWTGDHYCRSWELLGLLEFGPMVDVEKSMPPYENSRRLVTTIDVGGDAKRAHSMVVPGSIAAKSKEGAFAHEAVWRYLFTHPVDQVGKPSPPDADCRKNLK